MSRIRHSYYAPDLTRFAGAITQHIQITQNKGHILGNYLLAANISIQQSTPIPGPSLAQVPVQPDQISCY